jgi:hypothetical protein
LYQSLYIANYQRKNEIFEECENGVTGFLK